VNPARRDPALPFGTFYGKIDHRFHGSGLDVAVLDVDPHRTVQRHSHDEAHFVFVLDGLYVSSAAGAAPVSAGPALIFNPAGTTHRDRFEARDRVMSGRFLTLSIASDVVNVARREAGGIASRAVAVTSPPAHVLARRAARACATAGGGGTLELESLALALLDEVAATRIAPLRDAPAWLGVARQVLDDALGDEIRIDRLAREVGVHPVHLARVFRRCIGVTPGDYLRGRRLAHARALLRETRRPISDIAVACGFVDQSHFTSAFKRAFGVTPRAFRWS
jgi:AraC family transcriptional regulator